MNDTLILGEIVDVWKQELSVIEGVCALRGTCWRNLQKETFSEAFSRCPLSLVDTEDVSRRLECFAALFMAALPEIVLMQGILESPLQATPNTQKVLEQGEGTILPGTLMTEPNSHLPISDSIKARGGIYEVLKITEDVAFRADMPKESDDYSTLVSPPFQELLSRYAVCVGFTDNLGLSIDIISARLGFRIIVYMSADIHQWRKDMLHNKGVIVMEYASGYSIAVEKGRKSAEHDPCCHFVDDENSEILSLGYSVVALCLKDQLEQWETPVGQERPLFIYLPYRVDNGPGGVTFSLKLVFGGAVHRSLAEPIHSCCIMSDMTIGENSRTSVQGFGIDSRMVADGLAVGRASGFVGGLMRPFMSGCHSPSDERMYHMSAKLADAENLYLEPSTLTGMYGPVQFVKTSVFREYLETEHLSPAMSQRTQLVWVTGGNMVPKEGMECYYRKGAPL